MDMRRKPAQWFRMAVCLLMTSSLLIQSLMADDNGDYSAKHCPTLCECYMEHNYHPHGKMNMIICSELELTSVPDLTKLVGSTIPNNLALDRNEIKTVTKSDFPAGLNLVILDLSENREMKIATNALLNLGHSLKELSLEAIDIPYNQTITILDGLFSLQKLSLDHNNKNSYTKGAVSNVQVQLFQGEVVKSLKKLKLAYCTIRSMSSQSLQNLQKLEELDLSNNYFQSVPSTINPLSNLKLLKLFYCRITSLKDNDFSGLSNLEKLDLSSNTKLTDVSDGAFSGCEDSLAELNMQRCAITQVPTKALRNLKKLKNLDISETALKNVPLGSFKGEYELKTLQISSKSLVFDPEMFAGQESNIEDIKITRMNLKEVPRLAIGSLTKLKYLHLEYNNITELKKGAFRGIKAAFVYLSYNPISYIQPGAFDGLPDDLVINLAGTNLKTFEFLMDYPESAIHSVNLERTQLECQCSMKAAINITQRMQVFGACRYKNVTKYLNSNSLGPLVDKICDELNVSIIVTPSIWSTTIPLFYIIITLLRLNASIN